MEALTSAWERKRDARGPFLKTRSLELVEEDRLRLEEDVLGHELTVTINTRLSLISYIDYLIGEVISTQSKEVQRICLNLNIQVDNPVCILNQDISRNFLNTADTTQKFKLFMRATRLQALKEEYNQINENKTDALRLMQSHEEVLRTLKENIEQLQQKLENHQSIVKLRQKLSSVQQELLWAKVRDLEQELRIKEDEVEKIQRELRKNQDEVDSYNQRDQLVQEEINSTHNKIAALQLTIEEQTRPLYREQELLESLERTIQENTREKNILECDIRNKNLDYQNLQQEITKINEKLPQIEEVKAKRLKELSEMEKRMNSMRDLLKTTQNEKFQLQNSIMYKQEEDSNLNAEIVQIDKQMGSLQNRITSMKTESNNLVLYGRDMPKIKEIIERRRNEFHHMPRGPLGSYIKLHDKKWAVAVEGFIGSSILRAFAVDNQKDNALLLKIFNEYWTSGSQPTIITSKFFFQVHDVSRNIVKCGNNCISIYESVNISDPVVANCLIDQLGIESIILLPSTEIAIELMANARNVPENCRQGVTITGDKYYPDPNYKMYSSRYKHAQYLQVSTGDMIRQLETQLQTLQEKMKSTEIQQKQINGELKQQRQKIKAQDIKITKLNQALTSLKERYDEIRETEEPDVTTVHELETELKELEKAIEQRKKTVEHIQNNINDSQNKLKETGTNLKKIKEVQRGFEDRLTPLKQQLANMKAERNESLVNIQCTKERLNEYQAKYKLIQSEYLATKANVNKHIEQAAALGERLSILRDVNEIMSDMDKINHIMRRVESSVEEPEYILQKIDEATKKHNQNSELLDALRSDVKQLQIASEKRKKIYKNIENYFKSIFSNSFLRFLQLRQFKGEVEIDFKNKTLNLIVIPQQGSQGYTSTSNLSGGEKSFSTVAFLYSLWQCMEFPFYILDEFDVFMS
ncbi:structural maintenance of chromosomes protein 6 [Agrilus planipennis]|uniref:Structural maintenance of chromosomes protein 6 n=1 Tax=Agrilus planipennis TaxID=224129 RepID=A0A7F5RJC9_AGRPL|nr:structural maintenance of chromosomes protein 6 [Agrilus planipennis]